MASVQCLGVWVLFKCCCKGYTVYISQDTSETHVKPWPVVKITITVYLKARLATQATHLGWIVSKKWLLLPEVPATGTIHPSWPVEGAHLDSSATHPVLSGWLKRDGGVLLGTGMLGIPRVSPHSLLAGQAQQATAVLQTSPPILYLFLMKYWCMLWKV